MEKIVIVDGFNFLFRSYFATASTGMRNSKGFPTNALYAYHTMLTKLITEENPDYMVVVMDSGKTFRHDSYPLYKAHRKEAPLELKQQIPKAETMLKGLGISALSYDGYEADDIAGSLAKKYQGEYEVLLVTSDQDYLQLVDKNTTVKLLKAKDFNYFDERKLFDEYGLKPKQIIDLKALEGDKSDNIPGVSGIGIVGAKKLLSEYCDIESIYENLEEIKGKIQEKLRVNKENAFLSKELATIYCDLELDYNLNEFKINRDEKLLHDFYKEMEFASFVKSVQQVEDIAYEFANSLDVITENSAIYVDYYGNYYDKEVLGIGVYDGENAYYITKEVLYANLEQLNKVKNFSCYDYKRLYMTFSGEVGESNFDLSIAHYILDYKAKEISEIGLKFDILLKSNEELYGKGKKYHYPDEELLQKEAVKKAKLIFDYKKIYLKELEEHQIMQLYYEIELPLAKVLAKMELVGIKVDVHFLRELGKDLDVQLEKLEKRIFELAKEEFKINSYKQLGVILFEKLAIPYPKKNAKSYSTSVDILEKIKTKHEIVPLILEYRQIAKINSTYVKGLISYVFDDERIHTIFQHTKVATGRLSSIEPNLQNISVRTELGREIRKAFVADNQLFACDYSQIELRVLAHLSENEHLLEAFNEKIDIHTKTASDVYGIALDEVTPEMRRIAKAVNFGIIYGQREFGLSENLGIEIYEAKQFIDDYFIKYAGVKKYLEDVVAEATKKGYTTTIFKRLRYIEELKSNNFMQKQLGERLAMNTPIQGSAADIIKLAMVKIDDAFEMQKIKSKMILQVHDELIFDIIEGEEKLVEDIVVEIMENCLKLKVPLVVEAKFGKRWYDAK